MARPKIKRNHKDYRFIPAPTIPAGEVLKYCPLPAELADFAPVLQGPLGTAILTAIGAALAEGFSRKQLTQVVERVVEFYTQPYHRCNACFAWSDESTAGAMIIDGRFVITAVCPKCAKLGRAGRATEDMARNMQDHVFGGVE